MAATISCGLAATTARAEFRHQGPPVDNGDEVYTFAWGTSVGGTYVAGEVEVNAENCTIDTNGQGRFSCTMAAVWAPNFGSDGTMDEPFILPVLTAGLPEFRGAYWSQARAIDADGDTIVGRDQYDEFIENPPGSFSNDGTRYRALVWTRNLNAPWSATNAQVTELEPYAGYDYAGARGVSDDGNFAVGWNTDDDLGSIINTQAALWSRTGPNAWDPARLLGYLSDDDDESVANGVAVGDGGTPVVVGWSGHAGGRRVLEGSDDEDIVFDPLSFEPRAFVWKQATGMQELKRLSNGNETGARSDATAISADASTIVGWSDRPTRSGDEPYLEAVRWRNTGGNMWSSPQGLGIFDLPTSFHAKVAEAFPKEWDLGDIVPLGSIALGVSEHGRAVVGYQVFGRAFDAAEGSPYFRLAYFWSEEHGETGRYLGDVLKEQGVDIGEWALFTATGVREMDDFFIIVGDGSNNGEIGGRAVEPGYIARLGRDPGFTTTTEQLISFTELSTAALAIGTNVGATLTGLNEMAENHRCIRPQDAQGSGWCFFTFGSGGFYDEVDTESGGQFSGDVGIAHYFTPVTSAGVSVGAGQVDTDLLWDGNYRSTEVHVGGYLAHIPDTGLRLFGAGLWGDLSDVEITRGYLNGVGMTNSFGDTEGDGWGLLGRIGWGFRATDATLLTPFAQLTYTDAHLDGYSETGGPFPATFQDIDTNTTVGRIGLLEETDLSDTIRVFTSVAWAQVLDQDNPVVKGAVLEIFELSTDAAGNLDGWAEFMAGARYQLSQRGVFSVSGRASTEFDDYFTLGGRVGYSQIF